MKIRHLIALVFLFTCWAPSSSAQVGELRNNFSIGINGGTTWSKVDFQPKIKQNLLFGKTGGLTLRYISEKYFAMICGLQIEVNYSEWGWSERYDLPNGKRNPDITYKRRMHYLEVPFLAHLAFGQNNGIQGFLNLGPQLGFFLNDKVTYKGFTQSLINRRPEFGKAIQNKFDYGIMGGAGLEFRTRKAGNFLIEGRYYFGLADIFHNAKKDPFGRSAHQCISAKVTYLFDITR